MDLSNPARALLPTGTIALLKVLISAEASFTIRELARLAGVSAPVAATLVHRLAEQGIVITQPAGPSLLCRFNNDHLAARAIRDLLTLRMQLIRLLQEEIDEWAVRSIHSSLFGSAARGDGDVASDLDLLVLRPDNLTAAEMVAWDDQLSATGRRLRTMTGNRAHWLELTQEELTAAVRAHEPIVVQWRQDAVTLTGESLNSVLGDAA